MEYAIGFILGAISFLGIIAVQMVICHIASKMEDKKYLAIMEKEKRLRR
jgi:hypothetical protein